MRPTLQEQLEAFRAKRLELERSVLPLATSLDGRQFSFQTSAHRSRPAGGRLRRPGVRRLSPAGADTRTPARAPETTDADDATVAIRHVRGEGVILDAADRPFHDAVVRSAFPDEVRAWAERIARPRARLRIGELAFATDVHHELDAGGFDPHTFLCGQSGSGKTYALGVILERLLAETALRLVILDPNSDFFRLGHVRAGAKLGQAKRYREPARRIAIHSAGAREGQRLRLALRELETAAQAAVLPLDPIEERDELLSAAWPWRIGSRASISTSDHPSPSRETIERARAPSGSGSGSSENSKSPKSMSSSSRRRESR
jgi:hypothetical protein